MRQEDIENKEKKKKRALLSALIVALIVAVITHVRYGDLINDMMGQSFGYPVLLAALFFASFVVMFILFRNANKIKIELTDEEKKKRKEMRVDIIFLIIDVLMTAGFVRLNWEQLSSAGTLLAIAEVAAFFAIVWFGFEFFNRFKFFPDRIFKFVLGFFIKVCIPMLFLLVILLGAYQAKYGYDDIFRSQIDTNADKFAEVMRGAYSALVNSMYNIGQANPNLWIWLPIAAFFVMTLWLLYDTFTRPEKRDNERNAQEIIDEALKEEAEEQAYERGEKQRSLAYNLFKKIGDFMESKKEKERREKEKLEDANIKGDIYQIKFIKLKGGTEK